MYFPLAEKVSAPTEKDSPLQMEVLSGLVEGTLTVKSNSIRLSQPPAAAPVSNCIYFPLEL